MPVSLRSLPPSSKKRKLQNDKDSQKIKDLEEESIRAVSENTSLNPLADLLDVALTTKNSQNSFKAIYALYRVFVVIITNKRLDVGGDEAGKIVKAWLWERLHIYVDFLAGLLKDEEKTLRISSLQILFSLQKHLSTFYSNTSSSKLQPQFHIAHFRKVISALLLCPPSTRPQSKLKQSTADIDSDVLNHFYNTWFGVHDDIRWFLLRESATLLDKASSEHISCIINNLLSILERLTTFPTEQSELNAWWVSELGTKPPKAKRIANKKNIDSASSDDDEAEKSNVAHDLDDDDDDWRKFFDEETVAEDSGPKPGLQGVRLYKMTIHQSLHSLSSHRAVFTKAWLTLLSKISAIGDAETRKSWAVRVLKVMHRGVLPYLTRAILVMDWVSACVDYGGSVGLLGLNALFVLMKEYNLDYPLFYTRLYAFLDRDTLHSKYRARFFRMTELFLSSTHLPSTLLASFVKRLSRLSLTAPPAAIVMIIPFTYNTLKRHPALMTMIHKMDVNDENSDPFLSEELEPIRTRALESSLWELLSHRSHYQPSVATLCKIFSEAFTKPGYAMEDFLDHSYNTMFDAEASRKIKKEPALAVETQIDHIFGVATKANVEEPQLHGDGNAINDLWVMV